MLGKNTTECHQWTCVEMYLTKKMQSSYFLFFKKRKKAYPITTSMAGKASGGGVERLD